jgi:hypothetical protein
VREFVRITQEATYNVFNTSPTTGQQVLISLPRDNSQTVRKTIDMIPIRSAGSNNRRVLPISNTYRVGGKLMTYVRPAQTGLLATLLSGLSSGNCPNLPTFTLDHGFYLEGGGCTVELRRYLGCMADGTLTASNTAEGTMMMADLTIIGTSAAIITGTDFPTPAETDLTAIDNVAPYAFQDCAGALTIGSARTDFTSWSFAFGNKIIPFLGENATINYLTWRSRDPSVSIDNLYKSAADRIAYEALTPQAVSFTFTEGSHSVAFNLGGNNIFDPPQDDLKIGDGYFMQQLTLQNYIDPATGLDFTVTVV